MSNGLEMMLSAEIELLHIYLAAEREKVKELEEALQVSVEQTRYTIKALEKNAEQLAAAQATIEGMRSNLLAASCYIDCLGGNSKAYRIAHAIPTNQDALHEMLARECERLAEFSAFEDEVSQFWLLGEAADHRARKEEGK